jgi:hypothetical protein
MVVFTIFKVVLPLDPCPGRFSPRPVRVTGISYSMTSVIPSVVTQGAGGSVAAPKVPGAETGATPKVAYKLLSDNRRVKAIRPIVHRYYNTVLL